MKINYKIIKQSIFLMMLIFVSGCSLTYYPKPAELERTVSLEEIDLFLDELKSKTLEDYKLLSKLKISHRETTENLRQSIIYKGPNYLKIELYPNNAFYVLSYLEISNNEFKFYNESEKKTYTGKYDDDTILRFFKIRLDLEELSSLMLAQIPLNWINRNNFTAYKDDNYKQLISSQNNLFILLDSNNKLMQVQKFNDYNEKLEFKIEYLYNKTNYPSEISIFYPKEKINLLLKVQKIVK